jgi:hypothetical protein
MNDSTGATAQRADCPPDDCSPDDCRLLTKIPLKYYDNQKSTVSILTP